MRRRFVAPITRRAVAAAAGGGAVAWQFAANAQQPDPVRRIAVLIAVSESDPEQQRRLAALHEGLAKMGWVDGRSLRMELFWSGSDPARIRAVAVELVARGPDLIVGTTTPTVRALQQATRTIPIVFTNVSDPVGDGFVASMAHPGGNTTGFSTYDSPIAGKWLELLKEVAPAVTRVAVVFNPDTAPHQLFMPTLGQAAARFGMELVAAPTRSAAEIDAAITSLVSTPGGFIVLPDVFTFAHRVQFITLAARHRLPAVYPQRIWAASGGLLSFGPDFADLWRRSASYVDRILKGAKPADLPVQAPVKFEFVVNLKAAKALGLDMPPSLLAAADEVIE